LMRNKYPTNPQYWAGFVLVRWKKLHYL
jgi:CHAT domain-containing protein